jgi:hypothetical protein
LLPKYALRELPPRPADKGDQRVEKGGPFWDLAAIQAALLSGELQLYLTTNADKDRRDDLSFDVEDLESFFLLLHAGRCLRSSSQWCVEPISASSSAADQRIQRLADAYLMGYHRLSGKEQPGAFPAVYIKFSVEPPFLIIYSVHYERQ